MSKKDLDLYLPSKPQSHRQKKVAQEIRACLSQIISRDDWPALFDDTGNLARPPLAITITDVAMSPDLKNASVFFMPLGGEKIKESQAFLNLMTKHLRHQIASTLSLRHAPNLKFLHDQSFIQSAAIEKVFQKIYNKNN